MIKETIPVVMEIFSEAEIAALDEKLASLSMLELKSYINAARSSLQNQALGATWRPRIELGMEHAKEALIRGEAAAVEAGIQTSDATLEAVSLGAAKKAKKKSAPKAAAEPAATPEAEPESDTDADTEVEAEQP